MATPSHKRVSCGKHMLIARHSEDIVSNGGVDLAGGEGEDGYVVW